MTVFAFTSFTFSYLNRARVLANTLKQVHPEWQLWAVVTDKCPPELSIDWSNEPFQRVLFAEELIGEDAARWIFGHTIVEACTAVKGAAAARILREEDCSKLIYFDPDIAVFNRMDQIVEILENQSIVLTPHQTQPAPADNKQAVVDNEICSLAHGAYNLGFIALSNCREAREFCGWWDDRLRDWCHDRKDIGVFVDQKWCDLVPCFFEDVKILRDPGYNVASWNLEYRKMHFDDLGCALINGAPLRFFHFTKLGPVGDAMTKRYAGDNYEIHELWAWYRHEVQRCSSSEIPSGYWHYGRFDNGIEIPTESRRLFRERKDLQQAFANPFAVSDGFYDWLASQTQHLKGSGRQ